VFTGNDVRIDFDPFLSADELYTINALAKILTVMKLENNV
jgi:hypothetical protein